jgi:hypothetical protein
MMAVQTHPSFTPPPHTHTHTHHPPIPSLTPCPASWWDVEADVGLLVGLHSQSKPPPPAAACPTLVPAMLMLHPHPLAHPPPPLPPRCLAGGLSPDDAPASWWDVEADVGLLVGLLSQSSPPPPAETYPALFYDMLTLNCPQSPLHPPPPRSPLPPPSCPLGV